MYEFCLFIFVFFQQIGMKSVPQSISLQSRGKKIMEEYNAMSVCACVWLFSLFYSYCDEDEPIETSGQVKE